MTQPTDLRNAGLKATLPRLKILDLFQKGEKRHLTAEDIYRCMLEERFDIGLATVYRVLSQLEQAGLLKRSSFQSEKAVYELDDGRHHDHLLCIDCGRVEEFHDRAIEECQNSVAQELGFILQGHALALYGKCVRPSCPNKPSRLS